MAENSFWLGLVFASPYFQISLKKERESTEIPKNLNNKPHVWLWNFCLKFHSFTKDEQRYQKLSSSLVKRQKTTEATSLLTLL